MTEKNKRKNPLTSPTLYATLQPDPTPMKTTRKPEPTIVIFRTFRDASREVIALFPEIPHDCMGFQCLSYAHLGQHGGASPDLIRWTRPATPEEKEPLASELEGRGYVLEERKKISYAMDRKRMDEAKATR